MTRGALYLLFTASGFAGLIYESIWTQYLKLFLGHAAYAQSLVLAVFMGGMAAGAAWCGRRSARMANPLMAYAVVEALVAAKSVNEDNWMIDGPSECLVPHGHEGARIDKIASRSVRRSQSCFPRPATPARRSAPG